MDDADIRDLVEATRSTNEHLEYIGQTLGHVIDRLDLVVRTLQESQQ